MADIEKFVYYENGTKKVLKSTDRILIGSGGLAFEGSTSNDFETELSVTDPTADRTITFPDNTGTIVLIDSNNNIDANDNVKIRLGTGNDLEIYHDGTNSIIKDTADSGGSTIKYLAGTQTFQNKDANKTMAVFNANGTVDLHHNGNKKLETTSTGIQTTGNININGAYTFPTADGTANQVLQTDGSGTLSFATASSGLSNIVEDTTPQLGGTLDLNSQSVQGSFIPSAANTYSLGSATAEWSDLYLGDSSKIFLGNDQDVFLTHSPDSGVFLEMNASIQSTSDPNFTIRTNSSNTGLVGPNITLQKITTAQNDIVGRMTVRDNLLYHSQIEVKSLDLTSTSEYSHLEFKVLSGGTSANNSSTVGLLIEGQSASATPKVKISNAYYLPTADGTANQVLQTDGSGNISFASAGGISNIVEDTTPQLGGTLDLNSQTIQGDLIPSAANSYDLGSSSAEWADLRLGDSSYIYFGNDNDVYIKHNPDEGITLSMPSSASGTYEPRLTVSTENGDTNSLGPSIRIQNYSTGAGYAGVLEFFGENAAGSIHEYSKIRTQMIDTTTNAEEGRLNMYVQGGGNGGSYEGLRIDGIAEGCVTNIPRHNGTDEGLMLASTLVTSTAAELNYLDGTTMSANGVCKSDPTGAFITSDSNLIIESSGHTGLSVQTGDPTTKTNYAHVYAKDVSSSAELFVQDEAGNVTQISPHNEEGDWIYWSENVKTGKKVKINMEKMIRRLEVITGESFFEEYIEGEN